MRIQFCYSAFSNFGGYFRKKYGLTRLKRNVNDPAVFFGVYGSQIDRVFLHKALAVVIWAGSDALAFKKDAERVKRLKEMDNVRVIAISDYIAKDMEEVGIESITIPILPMENKDISPCPLGDSMYIYRPNSPKYGRDITQEVRRRLPHINVVEGSPHKFNREELLEVYRNCFIALRPISHDGCSNTVAEMGLMGRPSVWNGGAPHALPWETVDDVEQHVLNVYNNRDQYNWELTAQQAYDYYNVGNDFMYTEFYE